jgi:hypothetical protein
VQKVVIGRESLGNTLNRGTAPSSATQVFPLSSPHSAFLAGRHCNESFPSCSVDTTTLFVSTMDIVGYLSAVDLELCHDDIILGVERSCLDDVQAPVATWRHRQPT